MRWQPGGNLETVKLICERDLKKCFYAAANYVWSEIVTDVVDCLSDEAVIWRTVILILTSAILVYTVYFKIRCASESVINNDKLIRVGCKVQDLELKVNILTYKVQYGTWPLPHHIKKKRINDRQDLHLTSASDTNSWIKHLLLSPRTQLSESKSPNVETKYVSSQYESHDTPLSSEEKISKTTSEKSILKRKRCKRCSKEVLSKGGYVSKSENLGLRRHKCKPPFSSSETQQSTPVETLEINSISDHRTPVLDSLNITLTGDAKLLQRLHVRKKGLRRVKEKLESLCCVLRSYNLQDSPRLKVENEAKTFDKSSLSSISVQSNFQTIDDTNKDIEETNEELTISQISSVSEFPKESDSDEQSTAMLLQEALRFKQALLSQLEIENESRTENVETENPRWYLNDNFQSKLLDIITEERSTCSSTEKNSKTYLLLKMSEELDTEFLPKSSKSISDLVRESFESIRDYSETFSQRQNEAIIETRKAILNQDYLHEINKSEVKVEPNLKELSVSTPKEISMHSLDTNSLFESADVHQINKSEVKDEPNLKELSVSTPKEISIHSLDTNSFFESADSEADEICQIESNEKLPDSEILTSETEEIWSPNSVKTVIDVNYDIKTEEEISIVPLKRNMCSLDIRFPETESFLLSSYLPEIDSVGFDEDSKYPEIEELKNESVNHSNNTSVSYIDAVSFDCTSPSDKSISDKSIKNFTSFSTDCSARTNEKIQESKIPVSDKSKQNVPKSPLTHRRSRSYICPRKSQSSPRNSRKGENEPKRRSLSSSSSAPSKSISKSLIPILKTRIETRKADCESGETEVVENKDRGECQDRTLICINVMTDQDKCQTKLVDPKKFLDCIRDRELKMQNEEGGDMLPLQNDNLNSPKIIGVISSAIETEVLVKPSVKDISTSVSDFIELYGSKDAGEFQIFQVPEELTKEEYISLLETLNQDPDLKKLRTMSELCMKLGLGFRQ